MLVIAKLIVPKSNPQDGLSTLSQLLSTVKEIFVLSPIAKVLYRIVSLLLNPVQYNVKLSTVKTKLSLLLTGGVTTLLTVSLPQAKIMSSDNILRCINTFLIGAITFLIDTFIVLVGICNFFGVIPVNFSQCLLNHFKARFCNFLTANSFFNFFTIQFNKIQVIIQDTFLNPLKSKVSYI